MRKRSWDTEAARAMYDAGKSDREIAETLGIHRNTVYHWRFVQNLPSNTRKAERPKEAEPKAPPPRPSPLPRPLRLPTNEDPVDLSIRLDDGRWAFSIRAPDFDGVQAIYALAGTALEDMLRIFESGKDEGPCIS